MRAVSALTEFGLSVDNNERHDVFKRSSVSSFMLLSKGAMNDKAVRRIADKIEMFQS